MTGSVSSSSATSLPSSACVTTCTLPVAEGTITYPVALTTAASSPPSSEMFDATAGSGLGAITVGGSGAANPLGWWVNVPSYALTGAYTSTVTMAVVSAP